MSSHCLFPVVDKSGTSCYQLATRLMTVTDLLQVCLNKFDIAWTQQVVNSLMTTSSKQLVTSRRHQTCWNKLVASLQSSSTLLQVDNNWLKVSFSNIFEKFKREFIANAAYSLHCIYLYYLSLSFRRLRPHLEDCYCITAFITALTCISFMLLHFSHIFLEFKLSSTTTSSETAVSDEVVVDESLNSSNRDKCSNE